MYIGLLGGGNLIRAPCPTVCTKEAEVYGVLVRTGVLPRLSSGEERSDLCRDGSWEGRSVLYKILAIPAVGIL